MVNNCKRYYYTADSIGLKLKSNSDQWYSTIDSFRQQGFITSGRDYRRLNKGNFACAELNYIGGSKKFYAHSYINTSSRKSTLQTYIGNATLTSSFLHTIYNDLVIKTPFFLLNYVKVDAYRSIETQGTTDRFNDTEAMILENILIFLYHNRTIQEIEINLFTYLEPCLCCDKNIILFLRRTEQCFNVEIKMNLYFERYAHKLI